MNDYYYYIPADIVHGYHSVNSSSNGSILEALDSHDIILATGPFTLNKVAIVVAVGEALIWSCQDHHFFHLLDFFSVSMHFDGSHG